MQLVVNEIAIPESIRFNYEQLKAELTEKVRTYEMMVYTDDQIKEAKADKANLNKLKKALNDERIRREKEYMQPFNEFKAKINEIIAIIDRPIAVIDRQVKEYEEKKKNEKKDQIFEYLHSIDLPYGISSEMLFSEKWLNATVSMKSVCEIIDESAKGIRADIETLEQLDDYQSFAISYYRETLDLRATLNEVRRQKDFKAQQEKIEAERLENERKKAQTESVPEPVEKEEKVEPIQPNKPVAVWLKFEAELTIAQASELKEFFVRRGIKFRAI